MLLEEVDDLHFRWTVTCPACLVDFGGVIHKEGWLQYDPTCPNCKRTIAGFTNPEWPPLPETCDAVERQVVDELWESRWMKFWGYDAR